MKVSKLIIWPMTFLGLTVSKASAEFLFNKDGQVAAYLLGFSTVLNNFSVSENVSNKELQTQGWKIHISVSDGDNENQDEGMDKKQIQKEAAERIAAVVVPYLESCNAYYKIRSNFSKVHMEGEQHREANGKFIAIYPQNIEHFRIMVSIAHTDGRYS